MKPPPISPWPPLIEFARAPFLVRVRDIVLTILVWALLIYLIVDRLAVAFDFFAWYHSPSAVGIRHSLLYFAYAAIFAMLWLSMWSVIHLRRLLSFKRMTLPMRLQVPEHAAAFDLDPAMVERWRATKISVVQFDAAHRIASVTSVDPLSTSQPAGKS